MAFSEGRSVHGRSVATLSTLSERRLVIAVMLNTDSGWLDGITRGA